MKQRILFIVRVYIFTVLFFCLGKVAFMFANSSSHEFGAGDVADVVCHGFTLDLSTALYILCVPFLFAIVSVWTGTGKVMRVVLTSYFAIVSVAMSLAVVADTSLYPFWGFKLDASCLQYLATPTEAAASVSPGYIAVRGVMVAVMSAVLCMLYGRCGGCKCVRTASVKRGAAETALYVALIPALVIGIRGGLGESTTNIGQVFYSQNQFLNHSAVNPFFSFFSSFEKSANNIVDYDFMSDDECMRLTADIYPTTSEVTDTLLVTDRPNVVIILMESCGSIFTKDGGREDVTPNLNRMMDEGVYFENCYANSYRTDRGTVCTLSGYPSFPTTSVMKMPKKTRNLPSIAATLRDNGYKTQFLYGGDINFTNMRSYLVATGYERLTWMDDYSSEERKSAQWGVRDDITFGTLRDMIENAGDDNFFITHLTLSSHEPWDVPTSVIDDKEANSFNYLDRCIGSFIEGVRRSDKWDNLLIVMLPDHSINYHTIDQTDPMRNRIPMLWLGGAVKKPCRVTQICNQTDLAATLLAQMGLPHDGFRFSRDVMSRNYRYPFAVNMFNNGFSVADSTGIVVYDLTARKAIAGNSKAPDRLINLGKAILQRTSQDLKNN